MNPQGVSLNNMDLWVQIHDLLPGFMLEKIITEVGNQIGMFVNSCPYNFKGMWKKYIRIKVTIDISKPLRRCMKIRKSGNEWM